MKKQWVSDLKKGDLVDSLFLVAEKELRPFKQKPGTFLQLKLMDLTGVVRAKCWEHGEEAGKKFSKGDVVHLKGIAREYEGELQLEFEAVEVKKCREGEFEPSHFIPRTEKNVDSLKSELEGIVAEFKNPWLRKLLLSFFSDNVFVKKFCEAPGAKIHHLAYLGGLIEHTHGVTSLCKKICELYPALDKELLLSGAILHDVGKTRDYTWTALIDLSDEGGLLGHIVLGNEMIADKIKGIPGFPNELALRLRHLIISHQGLEEWGSPISPRFKEAAALFYADYFDSHVAEFIALQKEEEKKGVVGGESVWSSFVRPLERFLYLAPKSLGEEE